MIVDVGMKMVDLDQFTIDPVDFERICKAAHLDDGELVKMVDKINEACRVAISSVLVDVDKGMKVIKSELKRQEEEVAKKDERIASLEMTVESMIELMKEEVYDDGFI